ncbi:MAG: sn-glycerol-3-phosphate ABC transporter ATP-binding protein UgpC [Tepidisphaeraceae bacterium]|jgi:multiple sugar transport system ATP-binding protein
MAQVQLENVTKLFPTGQKAVDGVTLNVADREFVALVGPSGCGKTTVLRMVAGLEEVTSGVIRIGGRIVNDVAPKDRHIAMVFQNYALYPHMTVFKNMAFSLKMRGVAKDQIKERVTQTAKMLEIEHLLERKPKALSGGQRQRVAVGRAIVQEPAAFLFDEPLSNLDAKLRVSTRAELKRLHQRLKTTTLYVTHDQEEAMTLGDRIVVMKDGRIQQADTPLNTYHRPVNRFVAGFIGMPSMNFFAGSIQAEEGQLTFVEGKSSPALQLTEALGAFTLAIPQALRQRLERYAGKEIVLGIRPEHLQLRRPHEAPNGGPYAPSPVDGGAAAARIEMKINVIEPLGNNMDVYLSTAFHDGVVARMEARSDLSVNSAATMVVDLRKAHFFQPGDTGMNVSLEILSPTSEPTHALH